MAEKQYVEKINGYHIRDAEAHSILANLTYKEISISFSNNVGTVEVGTPVTSVTLYWSFSKTPVRVTLDNEEREVTSTGETITKTFTSGKTWTLKATDERDKTSTAYTYLTFAHPFYCFVTDAETIESVDGLPKKGLSISGTYTINVDAEAYIYFVCHGSISSITDVETGYSAEYTGTGTITRTVGNETYTYNVYRTAKLSAGTYKLKVVGG